MYKFHCRVVIGKYMNDHMNLSHFGHSHKNLGNIESTWYRCDDCLDEYFKEKSSLIQHVKNEHPNSVINVSSCEVSLASLDQEDTQKEVSDVSSTWNCPICKQNETADMTLDSHFKLKHKNIIFACDFCSELHRTIRKSMMHLKKSHDIDTEKEPNCRLRLVDEITKTVIDEIDFGAGASNASTRNDFTENSGESTKQVLEEPMAKRIKLEPEEIDEVTETIFVDELPVQDLGNVKVKAEPTEDTSENMEAKSEKVAKKADSDFEGFSYGIKCLHCQYVLTSTEEFEKHNKDVHWGRKAMKNKWADLPGKSWQFLI